MWMAGFSKVEKDGGSSTRQRQSWMETGGLWCMLHWELQGMSQSCYLIYIKKTSLQTLREI